VVHHFGSDGIYHSVLHSYSHPLVVFVVVEVEVVIEVEVEVGVDVWMDLVASVEFISAAGMRRTRATTANGYGILIQ